MSADDPKGSFPLWRVGRKVGNTIYIGDTFAGSCVTPEAAANLVNEANRSRLNVAPCSSEAQHANVGAGGGDEDGYNVVDGREAMATRTFIVAWLRNKERFRPGTGWATNEEIARLIESGDDGELPWGRSDA